MINNLFDKNQYVSKEEVEKAFSTSSTKMTDRINRAANKPETLSARLWAVTMLWFFEKLAAMLEDAQIQILKKIS